MKKIKCNSCTEEWYIETESVDKLQVCPFCQSALRSKTGFDVVDTLGKAIYSAATSYGADILGSVKMLTSYLYDYAPNLKKEIRIMARALTGQDSVLQSIFSSTENDAHISISILRQKMIDEDGVAESWASEICTALSDAFRYYNGDGTSILTNAAVEDHEVHVNNESYSSPSNTAPTEINLTVQQRRPSDPNAIDILKQYICGGCGHRTDGLDIVFSGQAQCPICGRTAWQEDMDEIRAAIAAGEEAPVSASVYSGELQKAKALLFNSKTEDAINAYRELANGGCVAAYLPLAHIFYKAGKHKQAWKWFREAANAELREGLYYVGLFYQNGCHVSKNERLAFKYYQMAAQKGYLDAIEALSHCYLTGRGCNRNENAAMKYVTILAEHNYSEAQFLMGEHLQQAGGDKNVIKAAEYYHRSAINGHSEGKTQKENCLRQLPAQAAARFKDLVGN